MSRIDTGVGPTGRTISRTEQSKDPHGRAHGGPQPEGLPRVLTSKSTFEAGIALTGTEIKSIRAGKVNLQEAYARIERGEAWLIGVHIAPFAEGNRYNHEPQARSQAAPAPERDRRAARAHASRRA